MSFDDLQRIYTLLRRYISGCESLSDETAILDLIAGVCRRSAYHHRWIDQVARSEGTSFAPMLVSLAASFMGGKTSPSALRGLLAGHAADSDEEIFLYFPHLIGRLMYHALYRRCADLNPAPKRMRHHVRQIIRKDPRFFCYYEGKKPAWIALSGLSDFREEKLPWSDSEISRILYQLNSGAKGKCELLIALLERITEQHDHQAFIEIAQLVTQVHAMDKAQAESEIRDSLARQVDTPLDRLQRSEAAAKVKRHCDLELSRMQDRGKLNGYLAPYTSAVYLMIDDLVSYCDRDKHWKYLQLFLPEVTEMSYRRDHRWFDELMTKAKRLFAEILGKME